MSDDPTLLARDANQIHQSLKELLTTSEPYDREVEFQRKKLRRQYLHLLLAHPHAPESKDVENHLWMQTSYTFIAAYKHQINALDRLIQNNARQQQQQQQPTLQQRQSGPGPVEHRKLLQRFRQFLAEEEKFWAKLVGRVYRTFVLEDAQLALQALGIPLEDEQSALGQTGTSAHGRNQQQFPPEESTPRVEAKTASDKESRMSTLSRMLVCLGDVARYRELYNEAGGRPKAGYEDGTPARRRNRRGPAWVENISKARNYDKAQQCYEQARLLVPNEGKPSHQLAILASYKKDVYMSLAHYYRALCIKLPYDTALSNMGTLLSKTLDSWRVANKHDKNRNLPLDTNEHPGIRVDKFKERVVVLHALWKVGSENGIDRMNSVSRKLDVAIARDFAILVGQRQMPPDMITQAIAMSQGALWKYRMLRDTNEHHSGSSTPVLLEWYIVKHVLDMHRALLEIGRDELNVPPSHDTKDDLGQQITATFRRTLPALRVASKWLRANAKYLWQDPEFCAYQQKRRGVAVPKMPNKISGHSYHTKKFWEMYAEFSRTLARTFPLAKLPKLTAPLEEDIELGGFLPLRKLMIDVPTDDQGRVKPREEVHPNEEQLMRIADLLEDARVIAELEYAPIQYYSKSGVIMLGGDAFETEVLKVKMEIGQLEHEQIVSGQQAASPVQYIQEDVGRMVQDDSLSDVSPDDDDEDVVRDAFSHLDTGNQGEGDEDDEDEIVFDPRPMVSPAIRAAASPPTQVSPISPPRQVAPPTVLGTSPQSPARSNGISPRVVGLTTAEDLLNNVIGGNRPPPPLTTQQPPPPLPFTSNLTHRSTQSIWSTSQDEQRRMASVAAGHVSGSPLFKSPTHQYSTLAAPQTSDLPSIPQPSIWSAPSSFASGRLKASQQSMHGNGTSIGLGTGAAGSSAHQLSQLGPTLATELNDGRNSFLEHRRVSSLTQQFQPQQQQQQQQQYQSQPPLPILFSNGAHSLNMTADSLGLSMEGITSGGLGGTIDSRGGFYGNNNYRTATSPFHTRHISYNDARLGPGIQPPPPPPVWGNT
ncbi:hypothetical protein AX15_000340 [Amanita polypyramis BW_CC]|nr:hypothetical protein AX15_000340 [Amanita polypyramis BW_CC]